MSGNGQDHRLPDAVDGAEEAAQEEEEDEFGEFEGFEGGVERMQAQPAPSPWATFPDLLPVQSSPATPAAEEGAASTSRGGVAPSDPIREMLSSGHNAAWIPLELRNNSHEEPRPPQPMRVFNPPDVSLGTNEAAGGRVTPDNVHDVSVAVIMDHMDNGTAQIDRLNQQLEDLERLRSRLEEQIIRLRERNAELEHMRALQEGQIQDLQVRAQHNQEAADQRLPEVDLAQELRHIQDEILLIKQTEVNQQREMESTSQRMEEMRADVINRFQVLESSILERFLQMERRLSTRFDDHSNEIKEAIQAVVPQISQQLSGSLSQLVCETFRNLSSGDGQGNDLMQTIKVELEKHKDLQRKVLEEEWQRQLATIASALQSALQHISGAMNNDKPPKDGKNS